MDSHVSDSKKVRAGLLVPSSNTVMEVDLYRGLPDSITLHTARMYLERTTREAEMRMIEEFAPSAAELVKTARPHFVIFGCTSAGSLKGPEYDREISGRISRITGVPTVGVFSSVRESLGRSGAKNVAVLTPYTDDINEGIRKVLEADGLNVAAICGMGIDINFELATPGPAEIRDFAVKKLEGVKADLLFISCTNFRAMEAVPSLEAHFGVPVVTSNTATIEAVVAMAERMRP